MKRLALLAAAAGAAQALLLVLSALPPWQDTLWGLSAWTYLPAAATLAVALASIGWGILVWLAPPFPARRRTAAILALAAAPVFHALRDRTHLLGDGQLWMAILRDERVYHPHEPLAFAGSLLATLGLQNAAPAAIAGRLEIWSIVLGALAVYLTLRLASRLGLDRNERWVVFGLMTAAGTLQFACGYVEAYPALWIACLLFLLVTSGPQSGATLPLAAGLAAGLAAAVHGLGFLLLPSLLVVLAAPRRPVRDWIIAAAAVALPVALAYVVLPMWMPTAAARHGGVQVSLRGWERILSALSFHPHGPGAWLLEQLNRWTLTAGVAGALILTWLIARVGRRTSRPRESAPAAPAGETVEAAPRDAGNRRVLLLGVAALGLALPALVLDTEGSRGAAVDWDAFAVAAAPLAALAGFLWAPRARARGVRLGLALATAAGLFGSLAFVAVNASPGAAVKRFEALAAHTLRTPRARGWAYETLAAYRRDQGDMNAAADFYIRALAAQPRNTRLLRNTAGALSRAGRSQEAADVLRRLTAMEPRDAGAWLHLGLELSAAGQPDSAAVALRSALAVNPNSVDAANELARILIRSPATRAEAAGLLRRSLEMAPAQPHASELRQVLRRLEADGYIDGR